MHAYEHPQNTTVQHCAGWLGMSHRARRQSFEKSARTNIDLNVIVCRPGFPGLDPCQRLIWWRSLILGLYLFAQYNYETPLGAPQGPPSFEGEASCDVHTRTGEGMQGIILSKQINQRDIKQSSELRQTKPNDLLVCAKRTIDYSDAATWRAQASRHALRSSRNSAFW